MLKLMEKSKVTPPEDWDQYHAFDFDKKPVPPEVDFAQQDENSDTEETDD